MSEAGLQALTFAFLRTHPRDAALMLEGAPFEDALQLLRDAPARIAAPVLEQLPPSAAAQVLINLEVEHADALIQLFDQRPQAVDLLLVVCMGRKC